MVAGAPRETKFVADKMLGRLVRWLRIVGQDVTYGTHLSGRGLIHAARRESRMILTRDQRIGRIQNAPPHLFIHSDHFREQLRQVVEAFSLNLSEKLFARCVRCNSLLEPVPKERVKDQVPPYVYSRQEKFSFCRKCRHIYWPATHLEKMLEELRGLGLNPPGK